MHVLAIELLIAQQRDFAADLWRQRGQAQLLIQVAAVKPGTRFGNLHVERIIGHFELTACLFTQAGAVFNVITERSILILALLPETIPSFSYVLLIRINRETR